MMSTGGVVGGASHDSPVERCGNKSVLLEARPSIPTTPRIKETFPIVMPMLE